MGDPSHFSIKGGANPHTRGRFWRKKHVSTQKASEQWLNLKNAIESLGIHVFVVSGDESTPGIVFAANAGIVLDKDIANAKRLILSNLIKTRLKEKDFYVDFFKKINLKIITIKNRFEGEADLFRIQHRYIFTYGKIKDQGLKIRLDWLPLYREYGFRTNFAAFEELREYIHNVEIVPLELCDERFYHGDTVLCPLAKHILVYEKGINEGSLKILREKFRTISISDEDAFCFVPNSFYFESGYKRFLITPQQISENLKQQIRQLNVEIIPINVSEFFSKGGGSIKCMILDLGLCEFEEDLPN